MIPSSDIPLTLDQWLNATTIEQSIAMLFTKLSILLLYHRIFPSPRWSLFPVLTTLLVVLLIGFHTGTALVKILECSPREKIFKPALPGHCVNIGVLMVVCDSFNMATDFVILALPVTAVWKFDLGWMEKVGIGLLFGLGLWWVLTSRSLPETY